MGGGGGTNTVQKADPWEGLTPYLEGWSKYGGNFTGLFPEAQRLYQGGGPQYYPDSTIAGPAWQTLNAEGRLTDLATGVGDWTVQNYTNKTAQLEKYLSNIASGNELARAQDPNNFLDATARGAYLNANPYLNQMVDASTRDINRNFTNTVLPGVASQFALGGRYGSGAQGQVLGNVSNDYTNKIGDIVSGIRGNAYNMERGLMESALARGEAAQQAAIARERGYQTQAQAALPELATNQYNFLRNNTLNNANLLNQVGSQIQGRNQNLLNADIARWDFGQNAPWQNLGRYSQILQGWGGGQSSSSQSGGSGSLLSNALGGAMLGNSLYGLGANAGLWGAGAAGLAGLGSMGLGSGALLGGATGLAATGALGGVAGGTSLFSTFAPLMALAL